MKNFARTALEKMDSKVFFSLLFAYQVLFIFQGFDLSDEGLLSTFYQQVFKNPETVQFSFMFWFSGVLGGIWVYLFPWMGLFGIRLAGVIVTTLTIVMTYKLLKKYLNPVYLKLGLFMVAISINNNPKILSYNNLSGLLYIIIAWFLFTGLKERKIYKLFISGAFVSLNMFTRLPNILGLALVLVIFYYGFIQNRNDFRYQCKQAIFFIAGFSVAGVLVLGIMKLTGQYDYFVNSVKLVSEMGRGKAESSYGMLRLIRRNLESYKKSFHLMTFTSLFIIGVLWVITFLKQKLKTPWIPLLIKCGLFLFLIFLVVKGSISNLDILYALFGFTLITALLIFVIDANADMNVLMVIACFILVVLPLGSSEGIDTVGLYSLWLAFPIALNFILNIKTISVKSSLAFLKRLPESSTILLISGKQFSQMKKYGIFIFIFACAFYTFYYPYFDKGNRLQMHYPIRNKYMGGIQTTKGRSTAINELLQESAKYVKPDDYLLAYDCMPMVNYMTETKPYIRNPWPWLYESTVFKDELYGALAETKTLPVIIVQKIKTIGSGSAWPEKLAEDSSEWEKMNQHRDAVLTGFLNENHYTEAWENNFFKILIPAKAP